MFESFKIGRPLGINLYVHGTFWLLPFLLFLSQLSAHGPLAAVLEVVVVLAIFACVALHELGHAVAAGLFGIRTRDITLYPIGGVARLERMPKRPLHEIIVALAGPAVNVGIVALLLPLMMLDRMQLDPTGPFENLWEMLWNRVLWGNIALVLFNLIPAFPMDGGRVFRAVIASVTNRHKATEIAATVGAGFSILFVVYGIFTSLMFVVLGFFLYWAGRSELLAVRREEERRQYGLRYPDGQPEREVFVFAQPSGANVGLNGWVFDAKLGHWVLYQNGMPIRHAESR